MIAAVAIGYYAFAVAAIGFTRLSDNVALLWIANAPLLAALLSRPAAERPLHLIGCFAASLFASLTISPYTALAPMFALVNIGEALLACWILRRLSDGEPAFLSMRSLAAFVAAAGIAAPAIVGTVPALALWSFQGTAPTVVWSNWVLGHGLGALIGTPVALLTLGDPAYRERLVRPRGAATLFRVTALVAGVSGICFAQNTLPLLFLPILPLIVAAMTFRFAGAALGVFVIAVIGAILTVVDHGPIKLIDGSAAFHLQFFQFYLAVLFLTAMPFAVMIAEKHRLSRAVAESEARYRLIAEHASDGILTLSPDARIVFASPSVRDLAGYDPAMMTGRHVDQFVVEADREMARDAHLRVLAHPEQIHRFEFRGVNASGMVRWYEATARAVLSGGEVTAVVTAIRDLSQRKAREADLERQATTDPMTGLLNRRAFHERLAGLRQTEDGPAGVVALLDLDHFKQVNDNWGHASGDAALLIFADVMRARVRTEDVIGRLGGEEFAILFPGLHPAAALAACERVRETIEATDVATPGGRFRVTVSIGLASIVPGQTPEAIYRQADTALYRAKAQGRNRVEIVEA